ncbi:MAG: hypothetical protein DBY45_07465 [Clostridiales bacterium]|nr:MAG: hypothetical protein DBY45_07465 [Clostridiales bacterium]
MDKGLFVYYGDFNVQQIPFYQMCHDAVRSGNLFWNWTTDLGVNFLGSYSFYNIGSPFFWLTIPFPSEAVPYLMAPLLMLKFATASVTSFAFLKRFVKNPNYALIGALLYAFSGFSIYNIFFNHFHEVIAFFPLLLLALEENVVNRRRGVFALMVALSAVINYYFFFGDVIFVTIYFFVRLICGGEFKLNVKQFLLLFFEAVLGVLIAAFLLLPSVLAISGNPRTDNFLLGWNGLLYSSVQRYGLILQSFFYPPDIPAYPNFFPDSNAKWSSVSMFLPLFSMTGVFAMLKSREKHWTKPLFFLSLVIAFIPFLNSSFSAFNNSYYARWFYMPILIMSVMTIVALEKYRENFKFGVKWTAIVAGAFLVISFFPSYKDGKIVFGQLPKYQDRLWAYVMVVVMGLILSYVLTRLTKKAFFRATTIAVCFMAILTSILMMALGKGNSLTTHRVVEMGLHGRDKLTFLQQDNDEFYRIDMYNNVDDDKKCMDNFPMYWQVPTIQAFHSVVPASIFTFYDSIGFDRGVGSRPDVNYRGVRALTSVKYLLTYAGEKDADTEGFSYLTTENEFDIYRNDNYVPMGFTYDYYVNDKMFDDFSEKSRDRLMLSAIHLNDEQIDRYGDILAELPLTEYPIISMEGLQQDAANRRKNTCYFFETDNLGFTAKIDTPTDELVFFSVPWEAGWTATVNGEPAIVENVNNGFMAVRVPAGDSTIRFDYMTPGLKTGFLITLGGLFLLIAYVIMMIRVAKRRPEWRLNPYAHQNREATLSRIAAGDAYAATISRKVRSILHPLPSLDNPEEEIPDCSDEPEEETEIVIPKSEEDEPPAEHPLPKAEEREHPLPQPDEEQTDGTTEK